MGQSEGKRRPAQHPAVQQAVKFFKQKQYDAAIASLKPIEGSVADPEVPFGLGYAHYKKQDFERALPYLERAHQAGHPAAAEVLQRLKVRVDRARRAQQTAAAAPTVVTPQPVPPSQQPPAQQPAQVATPPAADAPLPPLGEKVSAPAKPQKKTDSSPAPQGKALPPLPPLPERPAAAQPKAGAQPPAPSTDSDDEGDLPEFGSENSSIDDLDD